MGSLRLELRSDLDATSVMDKQHDILCFGMQLQCNSIYSISCILNDIRAGHPD